MSETDDSRIEMAATRLMIAAAVKAGIDPQELEGVEFVERGGRIAGIILKLPDGREVAVDCEADTDGKSERDGIPTTE